MVSALPLPRVLANHRRHLPPGAQHGVLTLQSAGGMVVYPVSERELGDGLLVGRYPRCHLGEELDNIATWSRVHVMLLAEQGRVIAYDTASTPGTVIDALHVGCAVLNDRSVLALGPEVHLFWERTGPGPEPGEGL